MAVRACRVLRHSCGRHGGWRGSLRNGRSRSWPSAGAGDRHDRAVAKAIARPVGASLKSTRPVVTPRAAAPIWSRRRGAAALAAPRGDLASPERATGIPRRSCSARAKHRSLRAEPRLARLVVNDEVALFTLPSTPLHGPASRLSQERAKATRKSGARSPTRLSRLLRPSRMYTFFSRQIVCAGQCGGGVDLSYHLWTKMPS